MSEHTTVIKKFNRDNKWVEVPYHRFVYNKNMVEFCNKFYGPPRIYGDWFTIRDNHVIMSDKVYMYWRLYE